MTVRSPRFPQTDYPVIVAGTQWHGEWYGHDVATGEPFDWTTVQVRAEIRARSQKLLAAFDSAGGTDGVVTRGSDGTLAFDLAAEFTTGLPVTRRWSSTNLDQRLSMWSTQGTHAMDMVVTDPVTSEQWTILDAPVSVQERVTGAVA